MAPDEPIPGLEYSILQVGNPRVVQTGAVPAQSLLVDPVSAKTCCSRVEQGQQPHFLS